MKLIIATLVLIIGVSSCGTKRTYQEKVNAMISNVNQPFLISSFNAQNLIDKSGVNEDGVLPYTYQTLTSFFLKEEGTGVDFDERVQVVLAKGPMLPNMYSFFKIKDQALFKEMIKAELNADIKEKEETTYFIKKKEGYVVAWQGDNAIVADIPFDFKAMFSGGNDGRKTLNRLIRLFEFSNEGAINKEFETFLSKKDDINTYVMFDSLADYLQEMNPLSKGEKDDVFKQLDNSTMQLAVNFENGKASFVTDMDFSEEFLSKLNFLENKGIGSRLLKFGKTDTPMFSYSLNINLEKYLAFLDDFSKGEMVKDINDNLAELGLTADDIAKAMSGEIVVMLDGYQSKTQTVDYGYGDPFEETNVEPLYGASFGLKDISVFNEILSVADLLPNNVKRIEDMYIVIQNDIAFVSNDSAWADLVATQQAKEINTTKYASTEPVSFYVNFSNQAIKEFFKSEGYNPAEVLETMEMFTQITHGEFTINLKDKSQNALKVLVKYYSDLIADFEAQQNQDMQKILDQEILDNMSDIDSTLGEISKEIEETLQEVDVDEVLDGATKELNNLLNELGK